MKTAPPLHHSPKRKRSDYNLHTPPPTSRLKTTNLPTYNPSPDEGSPRTKVAGHLQDLDLNAHAIPSLNFSLSHPSEFTSGPQQQQSIPTYRPPTPPREQIEVPETPPRTPRQELEVPATPRLKPVTSPLLPSPSTEKSGNLLDLAGAKEKLWWSEKEITGHELSQGDREEGDDGEGINGVGFVPTPAIAHARAERRKRQVKDWREREAREARQKRSERRWKRDTTDSGGGAGTTGARGDLRDEGVRKVRFLEA